MVGKVEFANLRGPVRIDSMVLILDGQLQEQKIQKIQKRKKKEKRKRKKNERKIGGKRKEKKNKNKKTKTKTKTKKTVQTSKSHLLAMQKTGKSSFLSIYLILLINPGIISKEA